MWVVVDEGRGAMNQFRLLIVDDDRETREALRTALEDEGYTVAVAANGAEAMAKLEERPPRLVLLDLMMPIVDGWEVLDRMRANPALAAVPVCICTALDSTPAPRADFVLHKPFDVEAVMEVVHNAEQ
ncbi:MAG TPA: response regulator [Polyangia bacterium]|nr:response regulator [Polyangia bacterium]